MDAVMVIKLFTAACMAVIAAAWISQAYRDGNKFWVQAHEVLDHLYERWYLAIWVAMMRHAADPAYGYKGRHFKCSSTKS